MSKLIGFFRPYILQPLVFNKQSGYNSKKFFLSFEDSLNYLFGHYMIGRGTEYCLLPNFYCPSTIKFISKYCQVIFYKVNPDFSVDFESYFEQLKTYKPRVIINYAFTGFSLQSEQRENLKLLAGERAIIIEDYAHRFLIPNEVTFLSPNHFYIDSIRKHGPLLGSHLLNPQIKIDRSKVAMVNFYKIKCHVFQALKGLLNLGAIILNSRLLANWAEEVFNWQDDLIGQNVKPTLGCPISFYLYNHLDLKKLAEHKKRISLLYTQTLAALNSPIVKVLDQALVEKAELNYYPLFVEPNIREQLINFLKSKNIYVDKLWEVDYNFAGLNKDLHESFIILPLTWLITAKDVEFIILEVNNFFALVK